MSIQRVGSVIVRSGSRPVHLRLLLQRGLVEQERAQSVFGPGSGEEELFPRQGPACLARLKVSPIWLRGGVRRSSLKTITWTGIQTGGHVDCSQHIVPVVHNQRDCFGKNTISMKARPDQTL